MAEIQNDCKGVIKWDTLFANELLVGVTIEDPHPPPPVDTTYLKVERITGHKFLRYWRGEEIEISTYSSMLAVLNNDV